MALKQRSTLEKQRGGKPITDSSAVIWLRDKLYPLLIQLTRTKVKYTVKVANAFAPLPDRPVIFAANHSAFQDIPIILRVTERRSYIFAGKQALAFEDRLFFALNGSIWVDRKSREDMAACKTALLEYLKKGQSVLWFPEGTWDLTPNLLMLPMKWGVIDVAREAGAQIIPAALDYDRENNICRVKFGAPIAGAALEHKKEAIRDLRDAMATLRWELWERQPTLQRADVRPEQLKADVFRAVDEYPPLDWAYESSCIYRPYPSPEEVFSHLDRLIPCRENAFLFRKHE